MNVTSEDMNGGKETIKKQEKNTDNTSKQYWNNQEKTSQSPITLTRKRTMEAKRKAGIMNKLTRNQANTIFKARSRMLKLKGNNKKANRDIMW